MYASPQIDSHPLSSPSGTTTRAVAGSDDTAQPSVTSGFGAVMEQERDIQSSTDGYLGVSHGPRSTAINRILGHQQTQLGANIALLEERYEMLPHPVRFQVLREKRIHLTHARRAAALEDGGVFLPALVAQHLNLLRNIDALITQRPDGQRGELILAEIARNHEEMAWVLTALIKEEDAVRDLISAPITASTSPVAKPSSSEMNWENEGGAPRPERAVA